ncbi:dentin sialophosphoprotein-like isoform X2 [Pseudomyrmex gracilis]|uniref:dentin sialophosphoprotein-like isoform X2 n=1 Tax=Pseudomyrmex gracilis TaxID=219809 RepID=UPI000994EF7F|nr:dentin sialophosphoprotein-like isoform X2 [Pseudomyrmex gracilis]
MVRLRQRDEDSLGFGFSFELRNHSAYRKIDESTELSNKICYKCVYELEQCTTFVQKYRKSHEISQSQNEVKKPKCCLCLEVIENNFIFDVTREYHPVFTAVQKIRNIFNVDFSKRIKDKLVCLSCRYNLDVLYDLKRVHHETVTNLKSLINGAIDYSHFPKVHTDIVNRKTTVTTFPDVSFCASVISDSETSDEMAPGKSRDNKSRNTRNKAQNRPKVRKCQQCLNVVPIGSDMYRFYRTGLTVCKKCWVTMDPSKDRGRRQRSLKSKQRSSGTKLCAVFLTDVLNEESNKKSQEFEVRRDKDGNRLYIISDESSLDEDRSSPESSRPSVSSKSLVSENTVVNGSAKQKNKRKLDKSDVEKTQSYKLRKSSQSTESTNELKSIVSSDVESKQSISSRRKRKTTITSNQSSDSDTPLIDTLKKTRKDNSDVNNDTSSVTTKSSQAKRGRPPKKQIDKPVDKPASAPISRPLGRPRKRLRSILEGVTSNLCMEFDNDESDDKKGTKDTQRETTSTADESKKNKQRIVKRVRSSSNSSVDVPLEVKSPKSEVSESNKEVSESNKEVSESNKEVSESKEVYPCDRCDKEFDNKLSSLEHKLSHLNQPILKLIKTTVSSTTEETNVDSQEDKSSEKAASAGEKTVEDPAEEIAINIDDDTDEEIFNASRRDCASEKEQKKEDEKNAKDKIESTDDATESDDRAEEKRPQIQSIEKVCLIQTNEKFLTKKSKEPDRKLNAVLDETALLFEKEDEDISNKDTSKESDTKDASKNQDTSVEIDTTVEKDASKDGEEVRKDVQKDSESSTEESQKHVDVDAAKCAKEDENTETENDTEISLANKEESVSERNKDEDDTCEKKTCDKEKKMESPDLSVPNVTRTGEDQCVDNESSKEKVEEKTSDKETAKSSDLPDPDVSKITNEDQVDDESGKKDAEKINEDTENTDLLAEDGKIVRNDKDTENGRIEEINDDLCDLTDECLGKQLTEKPEKQIDTIDITDETELLNDGDLNDIDIDISEIESVAKQQNKTDEPILEMEAITNNDKSNNVEDITIDLNPSDYGPSFDKKDDSDRYDDIIQIDLTHNTSDTIKSSDDTEDIITIQREEKSRLEEEVESLEELVRDNLASKCDGQETSNVTEILHEIFDRVLEESQRRKDCMKNGNNDDDETLENISREINSSADMPSLDPILELDDDNDIILG